MLEIIGLVLAGVLLIFLLTVLVGAPYVPSKKSDLKIAFDELYKISEKDFLIDIGSGDGVVLREASRRGAKALGYEINPFLVFVSRVLSRNNKNVKTVLADFWLSEFPDDVTVVYTFGDGKDIKKMAEHVEKNAKKLNKKIYFISYAFTLSKKYEIVRRQGAHILYQLG